VKPACHSIAITYDESRLDAQAIADLVTKHLESGALCASPARTPAPNGQSSAWLPWGMSTAAMAAGLLGGPGLALLTLGSSLPVLRRALGSLFWNRRLNVDVLDAAALSVLVARGQFLTGAAMVWLINLGDVIRDITLAKSQRAIESLFAGKCPTAWVVRKGRRCRIPVAKIRRGNLLVVYPGETILADGTVVVGRATVDQSFLTGESMPVVKEPGVEVFAGTVSRDGKLYIRAEKISQDSMIAKVAQLVKQAPIRDTRVQNYAERFADRVVPYSFLGAGSSYAITRNANAAAGVLIADYGTGIRVAAPTAVLSAMASAARDGILIKGGGRYLEKLAEVDTVVFDKTGTLTAGHPHVAAIISYRRHSPQQRVLALAAAAERRFSHPMAAAIERAATEAGLRVPEREDSNYTIGLGVEAIVRGAKVRVGCRRYMDSKGVPVSLADKDALAIESQAATPIYVALDDEVLGLLVLSDPLREDALSVVQALRDGGIQDVMMLTGDRPAVAEQVARTLGIDRYLAEVFPEEKLGFVRSLQQEGHTVAVVGDGVNDSPALAQADVGIAMPNGTDIAVESAHVVLLEGGLWKIPRAVDIAHATMKIIDQGWHINYYSNTATILAAMLGLIGPIAATVVSNGSAVAATLNALRPLWANGHPRGADDLPAALPSPTDGDGTQLTSGRSSAL
jgi:Cu2+-exporting ATPase